MPINSTGALVATVAIALLGYLVTYGYNLKLQQRRDRLERLSSQLRDFYGPLLALLSSGDLLFARWRETEFPFSRDWSTATEADKQQWCLWIQSAFMPLNRRMSEIITTHAHLIDEDFMPPALLTLCAHVSAYEVLIEKWQGGDYSRIVPYIQFPSVVREYVTESFRRLKLKQNYLLYGKGWKSPAGIQTLPKFQHEHPEYFVDPPA